MKLFFSRITADHWSAKNKLQEAAHKLAQEMDRKLISEAQVPDFNRDFIARIDALQREFPKCKPLAFSIMKPQDYGAGMEDYHIFCDGVFNMSLFLAKDKRETDGN